MPERQPATAGRHRALLVGGPAAVSQSSEQSRSSRAEHHVMSLHAGVLGTTIGTFVILETYYSDKR